MNHGISIVIPAFNAEGTLGRAVSSCLRQTLGEGGLEVIIVDDCSTDGTGRLADELACRHPDVVRVIHNQANRQCLESRRVGCLAATKPHLAFLDADDELGDGWCASAVRVAEHEGADIVVTPMLCQYAPGREPSAADIVGRAGTYAAPDLRAEGRDIVHASFLNPDPSTSVVWNVIGKVFSRELVVEAFRDIPPCRIFQCEDAYLYFVLASKARLLVSSSELPEYRYSVGVGGTRIDSALTVAQFAAICEDIRAAEGVEGYLGRTGLYDELRADYLELRHRLFLGPAYRYPDSLAYEDWHAAFDAFAQTWPPAEAIAGIATYRWNEVARIMPGIVGAQTLRPRRGAVRVAAVYCRSLGLDEAGARTRSACDLWRSLGCRVVLVLDEQGEAQAVPEGVRVERIPGCLESVGGAYPARAEALSEVLHNNEVDTLVYHEWRAETLPWDTMVAKSLGVRCVVCTPSVFGGTSACGMPLETAWSLGYGLVDGVVCPSAVDAAWWRQFVPSVHVLPNPPAPGLPVEAPHATSGTAVAWCGRADDHEGALDAVQALCELVRREPDAVLRMYGPCGEELREALMGRAKELGIEEHVEFRGPKTTEELVGEFAQADAFLLSSRLVVFSPELEEAKAAGLPCVAYDMPHLEPCQPGTGVLTAVVGDADGLGLQLARILGDDGLRRRLAGEALAQARSLAGFDRAAFWRDVFAGLEEPSEARSEPGETPERLMWRYLFEGARRQAKFEDRLEDETSRARAELAAKAAEADGLRAELERMRYDLDHVTGSASFKLGRALTAPLRKVRDLGHGQGA